MYDNSAKFAKVFSDEEREMLFLTGDTIGEMWSIENDFWQHGAVYLANVDLATGELKDECGHIFFDCDAEIMPFTQYRLKCRALRDRTPPKELPHLLMNDYLATEIIEEDLDDKRFEGVLQKYISESVFWDDEFGKFELDRNMHMYIGTVELFGIECELELEYDEEDSSAVSESMRHFKEIVYENKEQWDKKLRGYAANEIAGKYGERLNMTAEEIFDRLKPSCIYAYSYGGFNVEFDDDDLLEGIEIEVETDENGNPASVEIDEQ